MPQTVNIFVSVCFVISTVKAGHYIIPGSMPYDGYHDLHLPHDPPLYPTLSKVPRTSFTCIDKVPGYYADLETGCQVLYLDERLIFTVSLY